MRRAIARCSWSRSRIAAPKGLTTNGSSSSAIRCSTCCCPSGCIANFPTASEGDLSRLRARLVSEEPLAEIAQAMQLGELLLLGSGELKTGGFRRQSILADAFEALCGALYLDGGLEAVRTIIGPMFEARIAALPEPSTLKDAKTRLQEHLQANGRALPVYTVKRTSGEPHAQTFLVSCVVAQPSLETEGEGPSRRRAEQVAAQAALRALGLYD